jgi:hypothetical protein
LVAADSAGQTAGIDPAEDSRNRFNVANRRQAVVADRICGPVGGQRSCSTIFFWLSRKDECLKRLFYHSKIHDISFHKFKTPVTLPEHPRSAVPCGVFATVMGFALPE